ncbi:MAG TPA: indoleacetamide hydrolase [Burkholderiales bacterium]|nr:indoleacetamide hydrolase [Burkholderiales bacterium]
MMTKFMRTAGLAAIAVLVVGCAGPGAVQRPADLTQLSVSDAAALIRTGAISSVELTEAYLQKADRHQHLNAFITLDRNKALAAARQADADRAAGRGKGLLHGVPLVIKDNTHVAGMPNTAGTPGLRNFVPAENAPVVQQLLDAGAIVLGKTNMHELAFGISGYNEAFFQTEPIGVRNPYDRTRFAGGSSSGTGAAVGGRLAPGGLGSDTGGSVRVPAAVSGVAGLRPTIGRYSGEGITPISSTRDTSGPIAQTVADVALMDAVIAGETPVKAAGLRGVRLGVYRSYFFDDLDVDTHARMGDAIVKLQNAGVEVVEVDMPELVELNNRASFPVALYEAYDDLAAYLRKYNTGKSVEDIARDITSKDVKGTYDALVLPRKLPGPDGLVDAKPIYDAAIREARPALQRHYAQTFEKYGIDALLLPATPSVAIKQGPEASALETFLRFIRNADPGSNAGIPGLVIPAGLGQSSDMPVGIELNGPAGSDRRLLEIGLAIEQLLGRTRAPN